MKRVILCSGKHFYALDNYRKENHITDTAIIRLEVIQMNILDIEWFKYLHNLQLYVQYVVGGLCSILVC